MIELTKLNGQTFTLNALYIERIESFPDTTITLTSGRKYIVLDSVEEVNKRIVQFYQTIQLLSNPHLRGEEEHEE